MFRIKKRNDHPHIHPTNPPPPDQKKTLFSSIKDKISLKTQKSSKKQFRELQKNLHQNVYLEKYKEGIEVIQKFMHEHGNEPENIDDLMEAFICMNGDEIPLKEELFSIPSSKRISMLLQSNLVQQAISLQTEELQQEFPQLNPKQIENQWQHYQNLPFYQSAIGKWHTRYTIQNQIHQLPKNHAKVFANFQFDKKLDNTQDIEYPLEPPTFDHYISYIKSLIEELPSHSKLQDFLHKITWAYENDLTLDVTGEIIKLTMPTIEEALNLPGARDARLLTLFKNTYANHKKKIESLKDGESMILLGKWMLPQGMHAIGYVIEKRGSTYNFTLVDPAKGWGESSENTLKSKHINSKHINPYLSLGPISLEKMTDYNFHQTLMLFSIDLLRCRSREEYLHKLVDMLGVDLKKCMAENKGYNWTAQNPERNTCQMKLVDLLLKRWIDDGSGIESKKLSFALKAKSLLRFQKLTAEVNNPDKSVDNLLSLGVQEYLQRCQKFEVMIAEGKLSNEEFKGLLPSEDWVKLNALIDLRNSRCSNI